MCIRDSGYAVYDSANGARVGTLLWGSEKEADWQAKAQMEDLDHEDVYKRQEVIELRPIVPDLGNANVGKYAPVN